MAASEPTVNHDLEKNMSEVDVELGASSEMPLEGDESDSDTIMDSHSNSDASSTRTTSPDDLPVTPPKGTIELAGVKNEPQMITAKDTSVALPEKSGSKVTRYLFCKYTINTRVSSPD